MTEHADQNANYDRPEQVTGGAPPAKPYTVFVDDNFHHMDESERTTHRSFATLEEAIVACKAIVYGLAKHC